MSSIPVRLFAAAALLAAALPAAAAGARQSLAVVPVDAGVVAMARLDEMRTSSLSERIFGETDRLAAGGDAARFLEQSGLAPGRDIDTVVLAATIREKGERSRVLLALEGRFDRTKLTTATLARGAERRSSPAGEYLRLPSGGAHGAGNSGDTTQGVVAFVNDGFALLGDEDSVVAALAAHAGRGTGFPAGSKLGRYTDLVDRKASAWMLLDSAHLARRTGSPAGNDPGAALLAAFRSVPVMAFSAAPAGDQVRIEATGLSPDAETRELLEDAVRGVLAAWRMAAQEQKPELVPVIRRFTVERDGDGVHMAGTLPSSFFK